MDVVNIIKKDIFNLVEKFWIILKKMQKECFLTNITAK